MLARSHRLRTGDEFRRTIRTGTRGSQPSLVTHVARGADGPTTVGFVVSKAVGTAVDRNRVKRRLRHLMQERLEVLPSGTSVVVRALPSSSTSSSAALGSQLDAALVKALRR